MPELIAIDRLDDPRIARYRQLKQRGAQSTSGVWIGEGKLVVERAFLSGAEIESVLVQDSRAESLLPSNPGEVPILVAPRCLMEEIVGFRFHRGILACGRRPSPAAWEEVFATIPPVATIAACPHISDPVNLGTMIRLCRAFGVHALMLGRQSTDPWSRRVLRVSMGNLFQLPLWHTDDPAGDLQRLQRESDVRILGTVLDPAAVPLQQYQPAGRRALLFGHEYEGLGRTYLDLCDELLTIPMRDGTDSLNVGLAAGIFFHHFDPSDDVSSFRGAE